MSGVDYYWDAKTKTQKQRDLFEEWRLFTIQKLLDCKIGVQPHKLPAMLNEMVGEQVPLIKMGIRNIDQFLITMAEDIDVKIFEGKYYVFARELVDITYNFRQPNPIATVDREIVRILRDPRGSSTRYTLPPVTTTNRNYQPDANRGRGVNVDREIVRILRDPRGSSTEFTHPSVTVTKEAAQKFAKLPYTSNNVAKTTNTASQKGFVLPKVVESVPSRSHKEIVDFPDSKVTGIKKLSTSSVDSWENQIAIGHTLDNMFDFLPMRQLLSPIEKIQAPEKKVVITFPAYLVESKTLSLQKWLQETEKWDEFNNSLN